MRSRPVHVGCRAASGWRVAVVVAVVVAGLSLVDASAAAAGGRPVASPAPSKVIDKPRGIFYRSDYVRVKAKAAERTSSQPLNNPLCAGPSACSPPLLFTAGAPVMGGTSGTGPGHVTITPVYWAPAGYGFPSSYKSIVDGYLAHVAAASHTDGNVFSVADQYYQQLNGGPLQHIDYQVTAGVEVDTADAYPAPAPQDPNGCTPEVDGDGNAETACVTDAGLQAEVARTLASRGLVGDNSHLYMVFFPVGVETCQDAGSASNGDTCSINVYCGYHSGFAFGGATELYANISYPALNGCSDPFNGPQAPNGDSYADAAISIVSHEANEAITDYANAWIDANGNEDGDECSYTYGVPLGSTSVPTDPFAAGTMYNQTIAGGHYYTQDEFSNADFAAGNGDVNSPTDPNGAGGMAKVAGCIQRPDSTVASGLVFSGVAPTRVCDTRPTSVSGITDACTGDTLAPGRPLVVPLPADVVPATAGAVVANVTVTAPSGPGFLTVYPTGQAPPASSNLNFTTGQTVANVVTVAVGTSNGQPAISVVDGAGTQATDVVVDVEGYDAPPGASPAGGYHPLTPARAADTRCAASPPPSFCAGEQLPAANQGDATIGPAGQDSVTVTGVDGVPPTGVSAVAVNLTVVAPTSPGFVTVAPGGSIPTGGPPASSSINFAPGEVLANKVIVPVSSSGTITVFNHAGSTDAVIDIDGWYSDPSGPPGATFTAVSPERLADTRCAASPTPPFCAGEGLPAANANIGAPVGGSSITVAVAGTGTVPSGIDAAVLDLVDVTPPAGNFLTAYPTGGGVPPTSDVNWDPADTFDIVPGAAYATTGTGGAVNVLNGPTQPARADVIVDLFGYYSPPAG